MRRAGHAGLAATIASAMPVAARMARPDVAAAQDPGLIDGTLQAYFDTILPGRRVEVTELGNPIHPRAIAGVDPEPGAVEADALLLAHNPLIGFDALAPALIADLQARSLAEGGQFLDLDYDARERVCVAGLAFSNPDRAGRRARRSRSPPSARLPTSSTRPGRTRSATASWGTRGPLRRATATTPTAAA